MASDSAAKPPCPMHGCSIPEHLLDEVDAETARQLAEEELADGPFNGIEALRGKQRPKDG